MVTVATTQLETEVMQVLEGFFDAARHLDIERFSSYLDRSENTSWIDNGGVFNVSWEAVHQFMGGMFSRWSQIELEFERKQFVPLAEHVVYVSGVVQFSGILDGQPLSAKQSGGYVLVKKDAGWKIAHLVASS